MKRIAIFCDGTWNSPTIAQPTHVHQLANAARHTSDQIPIYQSGVGNKSERDGLFGRTFSKFGGGAFGWGLNDKIKQAYTEIAKRYEPGDQIQIFGFSRGAYTARSLAGMIRKCGFPSRVDTRSVNAAFMLYKKSGPTNKPDAPHIIRERQNLSPRFATSQFEQSQRNDGSSLIRITYIGIWDTVGALGLPVAVFGPLAKLWNFRHQFHDLELSSTVESARHAAAIDEQRAMFEVTPWTNLDVARDANGVETGQGLNRGDASPDRPYQQIWFVGDHSMVGGTGKLRGLTSITLDWIAEGAQKAGLELQASVPLLDAPADPKQGGAEQHDRETFAKLAPDLIRRRKILYRQQDISPSVRDRMQAISSYRPPNLSAHFPDFF